ncbi:MAG: CoA transferase, partial [Angustibacter sp.]
DTTQANDTTQTNGRTRFLSGRGRAAAGVRVIDLTRVIAGPVATRTLAGWGADVLRLDGPRLPEIPAQALDTLPGKRSAVLDFDDPAGLSHLHHLLNQADVLVVGYRPGALTRFGLDPQTVVQRHPHLTVVSISAWGQVGPWAARRGFDSMVQCSTGIARIEGATTTAESIDTPSRSSTTPGALPAQVLDHATGYLAAAAALLSVVQVARGGSPWTIHLSLAQTARWLLGAPRPAMAPARVDPRPLGPERYLVSLPVPDGTVDVLRPVGRLTDLTPRWPGSTRLGADPPAFVTALR